MWRKPEDSKPSAPAAEVPAAPKVEVQAPSAQVQQQPQAQPVRTVAGLTAEVVQPSGGVITSSIVIKGEIHGREDLYIDGEVQGSIHLSEGRVTVGPHGKVSANVDAREVIVRGKVKGSVRGHERVEIGKSGEIRGDISTIRIAIEEGAQIHSKVEINRADDSRNNRPAAKSAGASAQPPVAVKAAGELRN
jgi:cytoskeletal protein CcmA (bactofilin family)